MLEIDGVYYAIDLDAIMKWVSDTPVYEKNINTITTMTYSMMENEDGEEVVEKEVNENKSSMNDVMNNVRYDLIKTLLNILFVTFTNELNQLITFNLKDLSFGQKLAFNSLLAKKIIKEVNDFE